MAEEIIKEDNPEEEDTQKGKYMTFKSGHEYFGIEIRYINEIIGMQSITAIPEVEPYIKGLINLRGKIIPVIDVRIRFNQEPFQYTDRTCIIIINVKSTVVGLIVETIAGVEQIDESDIEPPPTISTGSTKNKYVYGLGKTGNSVKLLLDPEKLIKDEDIAAFEEMTEGGMDMNRKDRTILSKIKTSYVVAMIELMVLTGICFGLTTGKLQIARGQQYHGVGMICLILLDVMIVIGCIYSVSTVIGCIRKPLEELKKSSVELAAGKVDVELKKYYNDEIGEVLDVYAKIIKNTKENAMLAQKIANGDLTVEVLPHSVEDELGRALKELVENNNNVLTGIKESSFQLSAGAEQVAGASQALAQGSTQQASAIEQITASMNDIAKETNENATQATTGNKLIHEVGEEAKNGNEQMHNMIEAMNDINTSSHNISKVIKVIDDIAFQTNILALNATVEAARAGAHGKGFAVVAEEVKNLAEKSAAAANETAEMIQSSIDKVEEGVKIADETAASLTKIVESLENVVEIISSIATTSNEQATAVAQINQAIMQVSQVIQTNSATSEQCASASEELANQSQALRDTISRYKLKENTYRNPMYADSYNRRNSSMPQAGNNEQIISLDGDFGKY